MGAEVEGDRGKVGAPRVRVAALSFLTMLVVQGGVVTRQLLECVTGCWIHVCLFRRPLFSVMNAIFHAGKALRPDEPFCLDPHSRNELPCLSLLGSLAQADLRASVCPSVYMMDASPSGAGICRSSLTTSAVEELWRHTEQRGFHTHLQSGASEALHERGLDHEPAAGHELAEASAVAAALPCSRPMPALKEGCLYDCIELFSPAGNWSLEHSNEGYSVHPRMNEKGRSLHAKALLEDAIFHELASLAMRGVVGDWHARPPCWSFGTLRTPRLRSRRMPAGFSPFDPATLEQTRLAQRTAFLLLLVMRAGAFVSCEQPGSSVMFALDIFTQLVAQGCVISSYAFCNYGSAFNKPSTWLHNKPWLLPLEGPCSCLRKGSHFRKGNFHKETD